MKVQVIIPDIVSPSPEYTPREAARVGVYTHGLELGLPEHGTLPFNEIVALSGFSGQSGEPLLLIFSGKHQQPYLIEAALIRYADFRIPEEEPRAQFRQFMLGICKYRPGIFIDRGTFNFLAGKGPLVPVREITVLATSLGEALLRKKNVKPPVAQPHSEPMPTPSPVGKMTCPKCGHEQPEADECLQCGIVVRKYLEKQTQEEQRSRPQTEPEAATGSAGEKWDPYTPPSTSPGTMEHTVFKETEEENFASGERMISVDSVYRLVFGLMTKHFLPILGISVPVALMFLLITGIVGKTLINNPVLLPFVGSLLYLAAYVYLALSIAYFLDRIVHRKSVTVGEALAAGLTRLPSVMISRIANLVLIFLGFLCFWVPGVVFALRGTFIEVLGATEDPNRTMATRGQISHNLLRDHGFSVLATIWLTYTLMLFGIYATALGLTALVPWHAFLAPGQPTAIILAAGLGIIFFLLFVLCIVFMLGVIYILYLDLRAIKGDEILETPEKLDLLIKVVLWVDSFLFASILFYLVFG